MGWKSLFSSKKKRQKKKAKSSPSPTGDSDEYLANLGLSISERLLGESLRREDYLNEEKALNSTLKMRMKMEKNKDKNVNAYYLFKMTRCKDDINQLPKDISSLIETVRDLYVYYEDAMHLYSRIVDDAMLYVQENYDEDGVCWRVPEPPTESPEEMTGQQKRKAERDARKQPNLCSALRVWGDELRVNLLRDENKKKMLNAVKQKISHPLKAVQKGTQKTKELTTIAHKQLMKLEEQESMKNLEKTRQANPKKGHDSAAETVEQKVKEGEEEKPAPLDKSMEELLSQVHELKSLSQSSLEPSFKGCILFILSLVGDFAVLFESCQFVHQAVYTSVGKSSAASPLRSPGTSAFDNHRGKHTTKSTLPDPLNELIGLCEHCGAKLNYFSERAKSVTELYLSVVRHLRVVETLINETERDDFSITPVWSSRLLTPGSPASAALSLPLSRREDEKYDFIVSLEFERLVKDYDGVLEKFESVVHKNYYSTSFKDKVFKPLCEVRSQESSNRSFKKKDSKASDSKLALNATGTTEEDFRYTPPRKAEPDRKNRDGSVSTNVSSYTVPTRERTSPGVPIMDKLRQFTTRTLSLSDGQPHDTEMIFCTAMYEFIELHAQYYTAILNQVSEIGGAV